MKTDFHLPQSGFRIKKWQRSFRSLLFATVLGLLAGCVKDDLYDTPHPDKGAIVVQLDWSGISPDAIPDDYVLNVDGKEQTASGTTAVVEQLAEPGEHTLLIYNRPEGITIEGDVASVDEVTSTAKARAAEVFIQPLPGYLFAARQKITVVPDDTLRVELPMVQRTRDLQFELTVTEGDPELIQSVKGVLTGIAGAFNLAEQQLTDHTANTVFAFTRKGNKLAADARLLGIVGTNHTLVLEIRFTDREDIHRVSLDLSEAMDGFNNDMTAIRKLTGSVETPVGMDVTASITDWVDVEGSPVEAE